MPVNKQIQLRRDTTTNWNSVDPILTSGEVGLDTTVGELKIGDGSTRWSALSYYKDLSGYSATSHNHALSNLTEKSYNSLTDKPSIPSVAGLLDETAHDLLDHTGLTGIPTAYSLPTATTTVLGGVKIDGTSITINSGVISSSATGGGMTSESKSSSFTAVKDYRYVVDTSAGTVTATLPVSPSAGDYIEFVDAGSTWTGHDLILARNSLKINGEATDFTCDADNVQVSITYTGATYGWAVKVGASVLTAAPHTTGSHSDWPAAVSMTEVGYLDGVTSAIQNQINQAIGLKNVIINGNFNINQRSYASGAAVGSGLYGHDRWKMAASGDTYTFSITENVTTVTIPSGKVLQQVIEGLNLQSGTYVLSWTGTAQGKIGAGSYGASGITGTATGGTNLTIEFGPGTVSKVQFEFGSTATPFEARPYGLELSLCQRYCRWMPFSFLFYAPVASASMQSPVSWPTMRATPTAASVVVDPGTTQGAANNVSGTILPCNPSGGSVSMQAGAAGNTYVIGYMSLLTAEL